MDTDEHTDKQANDSEPLRLQLEEARTRIEIYEFQIANLRGDLEQIKMHAVLTNLGGAPQLIPPLENMFIEPARDKGIALDGMRQNLEAAVKTVAALDRQLCDAKKSLAERNQKIEETEKDSNIEKDKISSELNEVIRGLEADIKERENRSQSDKAETNAQGESEAPLRSRIQELEKEIEQKNRELADAQQHFDDKTRTLAGELEQRLQQLEAQIKEKEAGILAEKQRIEEEARVRIEELTRQAAGLESDAAANGLRIAELETILDAERRESGDRSSGQFAELENLLNREREQREAAEKKTAQRIEELTKTYEEKMKALTDDVAARDNRIAAMEQERDSTARVVADDHFLRQEFLDLQQELVESKKQTEEEREKVRGLEVELEARREMELRIAQLDTRLEESEKECRALREQCDALKREKVELEHSCRTEEELSRDTKDTHAQEIRDIREDYEKRLNHHTERLRNEYLEIRQMIQQRENVMEQLREQIATLTQENKSLSAENKELNMELATTRRKVDEFVKQSYDDVKQKMLEQFAANQSPAVLIELRQLFMETRRYLDAVRTFRQLLVDQRNQKYTPAVCLLVGEFYKLAGRADDAAFYLANPLIKEDSYAQYLLRKITAEQATTDPAI